VSLDRVATASSIKVAFADNVVADAKIQDYESEINLAVLAVNLADIPKTCLDTIAIAQLGENYSIAVGDPIIALGNPNGYTHSMELGMITSKGSTIQLTDNQLELFNTDIEDNVNSDGVIVDLDGHIIGLITRTLKQDLNEQISTVVGITRIKKIIERMANTQPRIYFGIKAEDMTEEAKKAYDIKNGIYVTEVQANSPAFKAGVKNGDIILQVNDQVVPTTSSFYTSISFYKPGEKVNLKIIRTSSSTNKEIELKAELEEKKQ
jgi:S1-C subfamily serine protease